MPGTGVAGRPKKWRSCGERAWVRSGGRFHYPFATVPPTTEYELTPLGRQSEAVLDAMADFCNHLPGGSIR